ncbi:MAG: DUF4867 family protein [Lachnospiraceae bacterium]|nr:DUF4867 family protein [Lachnospiraceae bacterium]
MQILSIYDTAFRKYGKVIKNIDFSGLVKELEKTPVPEGVVYEPSVEVLESTSAMEACSTVFFGEMPVQIGYCNGHNSLLNAVEYHRSSEINVAATDAILLVGMEQDVEEDFTYDTAKNEAFLLPAGAAVELYATTLHYAPCGVNGTGFQVAVVLPKGTNYPLEKEHAKVEKVLLNEDVLLAATNKWLIGHAEGGLDNGAFIGLKGRNLNVCE